MIAGPDTAPRRPEKPVLARHRLLIGSRMRDVLTLKGRAVDIDLMQTESSGAAQLTLRFRDYRHFSAVLTLKDLDGLIRRLQSVHEETASASLLRRFVALGELCDVTEKLRTVRDGAVRMGLLKAVA